MFQTVHRAIIGLIRRLPGGLALLTFRVFNKTLRMLRPRWPARTNFGAQMECDPGDLIQCCIFHFGVWEPDVSWVIQSILAEGDIVVDIGANIGYDTLLASGCVGRSGGVIAIEAAPTTFELLRSNLARNDSSNVRAVRAAVSDTPRTLQLYGLSPNNIGSITTIASRGGRSLTTVRALPLEDILRPDEMARIRLVKIDIEGGEPPVLNHMLDTLALYPDTTDFIVEASEADAPDAWTALFERLREAGFSAWLITNRYEFEWYMRWREPTPLQRIETLPHRQVDLFLTRGSVPSALTVSDARRRRTMIWPRRSSDSTRTS